jgi:hypothetical protein
VIGGENHIMGFLFRQEESGTIYTSLENIIILAVSGP